MQPYTKEFYRRYQEGVRRSAEEIVPLVMEMIRPRRVVDVGCGIGAWLAVFKELMLRSESWWFSLDSLICGLDSHFQ